MSALRWKRAWKDKHVKTFPTGNVGWFQCWVSNYESTNICLPVNLKQLFSFNGTKVVVFIYVICWFIWKSFFMWRDLLYSSFFCSLVVIEVIGSALIRYKCSLLTCAFLAIWARLFLSLILYVCWPQSLSVPLDLSGLALLSASVTSTNGFIYQCLISSSFRAILPVSFSQKAARLATSLWA